RILLRAVIAHKGSADCAMRVFQKPPFFLASLEKIKPPLQKGANVFPSLALLLPSPSAIPHSAFRIPH
ncbi:MAG: hypothetical protein IJT69_02290, partial [Clostridia bacterium]|nr:hypothetical protein [Clostridia bacterium]